MGDDDKTRDGSTPTGRKIDLDLFKAWMMGDQRAGQAIFQRHHGRITRYFLNKAGDDVEDLVQRTFMVFVEAKDRFRQESSVSTFLIGIARNLLLEHLRARYKASDVVTFDELSVVQLKSSPSAVLVREEEQILVRDALRAIPLLSQEVLELVYWEDLTGPQIAELLGITEPAVRNRLRRAKLELAKMVDRLARAPVMATRVNQDLEGWVRSLRMPDHDGEEPGPL